MPLLFPARGKGEMPHTSHAFLQERRRYVHVRSSEFTAIIVSTASDGVLVTVWEMFLLDTRGS